MSGLPWDDKNVRPNLLTLSRLKKGDKLSVVKKGAVPNDKNFRNIGRKGRGLRALFDIQPGGWKHRGAQAFERRKKGESLSNDRQYLIPLTKLFEKAYNLCLMKRENVKRSTIQAAFNGLSVMRQTYSSGSDNRKMNQIITTIKARIPKKTIPGNIIELKGNQNIDLCTRTELGDIKALILGFLSKGDSDYYKEADDFELNTKLTAKGIYGTQKPLQKKLVMLPTNPKSFYYRKKLGLCVIGVKDWKRNAPGINGIKLNFTNEGLKDLYFKKLKEDEGMLFLLSQVASQAGLEAMSSLLMMHRTPANYRARKLDLPFQYQGMYIYAAATGHETNISIGSNAVMVTTKLNLHANLPYGITAFYPWQDPNSTKSIPITFKGTDKGITSLEMTFSMRLKRLGTRIRWEVTKANLKFAGR